MNRLSAASASNLMDRCIVNLLFERISYATTSPTQASEVGYDTTTSLAQPQHSYMHSVRNEGEHENDL